MRPTPALTIAAAEVRDPAVTHLLGRHLAQMASQSPPEDVHALDLTGLTDPSVTLFAGRVGDDVVCVGALRTLDADHVELKSMHTAAEARGQGYGRAMLTHLLDEAARRGARRVSLETGAQAAFAPARALYASVGFEPCPPFADYAPSPASTFLTRLLPAPGPRRAMQPDAGARARLALTGLSVGDAFGQGLFGLPDDVAARMAARAPRPGPWRWTDDTAMAVSVTEVLLERGTVDQDRLAALFAARYRAEPARGYGGGTHGLLREIGAGARWWRLAPAMFDGQGSHGNGAAMRVAPLGGYFADDPDRCAAEAVRSAVVTHAHPEAVAGTVAVAVAAALAAREGPDVADELVERTLPHVLDGEVRRRLERAQGLGVVSSEEAAAVLGSGQEISAVDTVPFVLWCAARRLDDVEEALWGTVAGLGDRDTTCAMVGGIVALATGTVPAHLVGAREPLPAPFGDA